MKVNLINKPTFKSAKTQIFYNRGITDIEGYLNAGMPDVSPPEAFGKELMELAAKTLITHIAAENPVLVILDSDMDGFTSGAILINYLHDLFPSFVENKLDWFMHKGKQHGLADCVEECKKYKLILCPDSASNDIEQFEELTNLGIDIICLDHHIVDRPSNLAIVINSQNPEYPNKELSGAGVVYQFCRFLDEINNTSYADTYLDLVAGGLQGDMMEITNPETKTLILEGFKEENIKNPFISYMAEKNSFPLSKTDYKPSPHNNLQFTPMGASFFIVPFVNAIVRSGTQEEKELIFNSMLKYKAFEMILSNKRGHKLGEKEKLVVQAIRTCTNVKNRQTRAETAGMELLEKMIKEQNLLNHKVLLFLLQPGEIDKNIAGLCANKIMAKYQRPACVLTEVIDVKDYYAKDAKGNKLAKFKRKRISFQGSARGYSASGVKSFKNICAAAPGCFFTAGHDNAFGLGLGYDYPGEEEVAGEFIYQFIDYTDEALKDMASEPSYSVDYIWNYDEIDGEKIFEIADLNDYIGQGFERPLIYVKNIPVNDTTFKVMKSNTLRYVCPVADIIQFGASDDQVEDFQAGPRIINAVCKAGKNEWNGGIDPQLVLVDYEVVEEKEKTVLETWGF